MNGTGAIRKRRQVTVDQAASMLDLVPSADTGSKRSLLSAASRSLPDPRILSRWISLAGAEEDTGLKEEMLARILHCDFRQIPDTGAYLDLLLWGLTRDRLRVPAIAAIGSLAAAGPKTTDLLTRLYREQRTRSAQRQILAELLRSDSPDPALAAFFLSVLGSTDADLRTRIVRLLLLTDALPLHQIDTLLRSPGPAELRRDLLRYARDRSLPLEDTCSHVLVHDDDAGCRLEAVQALALLSPGSAETVRNVIAAGQNDPSANVREACLFLIRFSMDLAPSVQMALAGDLRTETSRQNCLMILWLLAPYLGTSPPLRDAMLALLGENLHADIAGPIYTMLGSLASWDPSLLEWLVEAYRKSTDDSVRGAILKSLSGYHEPSERLTAIYREALVSPVPRLKHWSLGGILMLPLTPENAGAVAAAAIVLMDPALDRDMRLAAARKVCRIPDPPPETTAILKTIVEQSRDPDLVQVCREAFDRSLRKSPAGSIDFGHWLYRAEATHTVDGIFPQIYAVYDEFADQCRQILKVVLLDPANADSRYRNSVSEAQILRFLASRNAVDDDICRFCTHRLLTRNEGSVDPDLCLTILRSHPEFPGLEETLWQIFRRKADVERCNPVLLRFSLAAACRGEAEAGRRFRDRLFSQTSPGAAAPYLAFLTRNLLWPPAEAMIRDAAARPSLLDAEARRNLSDALREYGGTEAGTVKPVEPGVTDD